MNKSMSTASARSKLSTSNFNDTPDQVGVNFSSCAFYECKSCHK